MIRRADSMLGNMPTTRVRRRISRLRCSTEFVVARGTTQWVITVHDWETIRLRCGRNKEPIKRVSRETGIASNTIRKYLRQAEPPARRPRPRPRILDPYVSHVDELIKSTPKITAARIGSYLREHVDAALHVDERTLRKFVAFRRTLLVPKEAFLRANYAPGDQAQIDFSPTPTFDDIASLNAALLAFCDRDRFRTQAGQTETIGGRFAHEAPLLGALPDILPHTCVVEPVRINKFAECNYETNRYSVPTRYAHRDAFIEVYEEKIRVIVGADVVPEHRRHFGKNGRYLDVRHYLELLARKHRAAETALVLSDAQIPMEIRELLERYRASENSTATKRWTKVFVLLDHRASQRQFMDRSSRYPLAIRPAVRSRPRMTKRRW